MLSQLGYKNSIYATTNGEIYVLQTAWTAGMVIEL